jgi:hypothetical protein
MRVGFRGFWKRLQNWAQFGVAEFRYKLNADYLDVSA